jgi:hypothetical protein
MRMWDVASRRLGRVPVVSGAVTTTGMFDRFSEFVLDGQAVSVENALTVKTSELGGLTYGDLLTVDGASYMVRHEPMRVGDGMLCIVPLKAVAGDAVSPGKGIKQFELSDLADVEIRDPKVGDRLMWNGEKWVDEESDDGTNVYDGGGAEQ